MDNDWCSHPKGIIFYENINVIESLNMTYIIKIQQTSAVGRPIFLWGR